jgi:serine/threonine protein kinase
MADDPIDDPRLLSVAGSISSGDPVDWPDLDDGDDPESTAVLNELRLLADLSQLGDPAPSMWGPFTIVGELGRGAYGTVYRAVDPKLNHEVALKVIPRREETGRAAADPLAEARLLAQVNDPHVVRVYRVEEVGNEVGVAMELIDGETLHDLVKERGPFSAAETAVLGAAISRALAAVHRQKLLHGDVKAHNVMRAAGGRVVLMDFGAGRDLKTGAPASTAGVKGTPMYMAPEVMAGGARTNASDIYSLGVLLFYLVTGSYPIASGTRQEVAESIRTGARRQRLRDLRPDLPDDFIRVVERAIAERPEERYQSAGELEADLVRRPAPVPPPPVPPFPWKWALAGGGVVVLIVAALWSSRLIPGPSSPAPVASAPAMTSPAAAAGETPGAYRIDAVFYREQNGQAVRLDQGARISLGDRLSLRVRSSVPTYVYIVNEDEQGESFLLFPLPGQALQNPLPPDSRHELPGVVNGQPSTWEVTTTGGREHFLVFASPQEPLAALAEFFEKLPRATPGRPVTYPKLSGDNLAVLRGVGGLAQKRPSPDNTGRLSSQFAAPLPSDEETARGVWVRQLTLENPVK